MPDRAEQLLAVLLVETLLGYPTAIHQRIAHPVVWTGRLIAAMDRRWNRPGRSSARFPQGDDDGQGKAAGTSARLAGIAAAAILVLLATIIGLALEHFLVGWAGMALIILIATTGLAQKSLHDHVTAVMRPLAAGRLEEARSALAMIVGRDTQALDEQGIAAAATESLAESFCDGVVTPAFWFLLGGLPGLFIFKAISTADSLIGHLDERHRYFGWASARLDDAMNFVPARLSGLLICLAAFLKLPSSLRIMFRDARSHLSPNAGWPEAAMAGALGVRLGGGACYDGEWIARAELGEGPRPSRQHLSRALTLYRRALLLLWFIAGGLAWAL